MKAGPNLGGTTEVWHPFQPMVDLFVSVQIVRLTGLCAHLNTRAAPDFLWNDFMQLVSIPQGIDLGLVLGTVPLDRCID
jgi:hypothetical protein